MIETTLNASIPKTNFAYSGHDGSITTIEPSAQAVINSGVYDSALKQTSFSCSTGNCTFDIYNSMGWCSQCEDVSDQIEFQYSNSGAISFVLPSSNLSATAGSETFVMGSSGYTIQAILGWTTNGTADPLSDTEWGKRGFGAAECSINPCIRQYRSAVQGGRLSENFTSLAWNSSDYEVDYEVDYIDVSCLNSSETQELKNSGFNFNTQTTPWLRLNGWNVTHVDIRAECVYQAVGPQVSSLYTYLDTMFSGTLIYSPVIISGSTVLQTVFRGGNVTYSTIDDMFNRIAQGLTVWGREHGENVTGQVWRSDTCVDAEWKWVAYPVCLVFGTIVFLVWTIDHTRRKEGSRQDYKSSPLAFLFHRLGSVGTEGPVSNIKSNGDLQKKAKAMRVVFQGTDDIWRFTEVEEPHTPEAKKRAV